MCKVISPFYVIVGLIMLASCSAETNIYAKETQATSLLTEDNITPLNVHNPSPRLSWLANVDSQSNYQIHVASSLSKLVQGQADLWDSGKVTSNISRNVSYKGKALSTNDRAFWRLRVWKTGEDTPTAWSEPTFWQMGLLHQSDWQAKWIKVSTPTTANLTSNINQWISHAGTVETPDGTIEKPTIDKLESMPSASLFRQQFSVNKKLISATLHSTAGGYYEVFINGQKVKNRIMDPGQTDFDQRIMYNTDDVAPFLQQGENAIAVHLGSGWYNEDIAFSKWKDPDGKYNNKADRSYSFGQPKFIAQLSLTFDDGSTQVVKTDKRWLTHPSPVIKEGIFSGELFDANKHIPHWNKATNTQLLSDWQPAKELASWPTKALVPQLLPPIRPIKTLKPVSISNPSKNIWVFDFGQNFTGIPTLHLDKLSLNENQAVFLRYAEWQDKQGNISQLSGGGWATHLNPVDGYIATTNNTLQTTAWTPTFTWRGFRYVEITGLAERPPLDALSAQLVRSDVQKIGSFTSSDPLINRIHQTALWTYESNLMSVPLDCPIREKAGWTGDAHAALVTGNYNFHMQNFWEKYLGDFQTAEHLAPTVVPGKRTGGGMVDWAAAEVLITWEHYRHYGDRQTLENQYDSLQKYMDFGQSLMSEYLIFKGYGDWCDPVKQAGTKRVGGRGTSQWTSTEITSTALFTQAANYMSKIAEVLDRPLEAKEYQGLYHNLSEGFHEAFYDEKTGHYGSQTADAMAIQFGITPEHLRQGVADALNKDIVENWSGHSSVGALGQTYLYLTLSDYGYTNTAFNIFKAQGYPGFSYLFDTLNGTTLWERKGAYDPKNEQGPVRSLNHPFHSGFDGWFYQGLGGIRPLENSVGFQQFLLKPVFPDNLNDVDVSYTSGYGKVISKWSRVGDTIHWQAQIPDNTSAWIELPHQQKRLYEAGTYHFSFQP